MSGESLSDGVYLAAIANFHDALGYAPSVRDIAELARPGRPPSSSVVLLRLKKLRALGLLQYEDGIARSVRLTPAGRAAIR